MSEREWFLRYVLVVGTQLQVYLKDLGIVGHLYERFWLDIRPTSFNVNESRTIKHSC